MYHPAQAALTAPSLSRTIALSSCAKAAGSLAGVELRDASDKQFKGIQDRQRVHEVMW